MILYVLGQPIHLMHSWEFYEPLSTSRFPIPFLNYFASLGPRDPTETSLHNVSRCVNSVVHTYSRKKYVHNQNIWILLHVNLCQFLLYSRSFIYLFKSFRRYVMTIMLIQVVFENNNRNMRSCRQEDKLKSRSYIIPALILINSDAI